VAEVVCRKGEDGSRVEVQLDFELTPSLRREGLLRTFMRQLQDLRRKSGLRPGEPVAVVYAADDELAEAIETGREQLQARCFASSLERLEPAAQPPKGFTEPGELRVPEHSIWVALRRLGQGA
jgi:isoleucyl-tRNA synthetase